jgi:hypothetical protein
MQRRTVHRFEDAPVDRGVMEAIARLSAMWLRRGDSRARGATTRKAGGHG